MEQVLGDIFSIISFTCRFRPKPGIAHGFFVVVLVTSFPSRFVAEIKSGSSSTMHTRQKGKQVVFPPLQPPLYLSPLQQIPL
ncbi:hypothetical protein BLA29_005724 [Euroglyphus maynei]|uniref:Uncharacterized protein n=1 Tax=Euroglyphus maynei TaxID=6958 RepID=A0A1Y3AWT2_EURMA|nr:hypothetical protein BLA29_005724 [Euroglyphus maynei]